MHVIQAFVLSELTVMPIAVAETPTVACIVLHPHPQCTYSKIDIEHTRRTVKLLDNRCEPRRMNSW